MPRLNLILPFLLLLSLNGSAQIDTRCRSYDAGYCYQGFSEFAVGWNLNIIKSFTPPRKHDGIDPGGGARPHPVVYARTFRLGVGYAPWKQLGTVSLSYQYCRQQFMTSWFHFGVPLVRVSVEAVTDAHALIPCFLLETGFMSKIRYRYKNNGNKGFIGKSWISFSAGVMYSPMKNDFEIQQFNPVIRLNWILGGQNMSALNLI